MTKDNLRRILMVVEEETFDETMFNEFYTDDRSVIINEDNLNTDLSKALTFDYKKHNLKYVEGSISSTGLNLIFKSDRFIKISVAVYLDYPKLVVYNSVLATPKYTDDDYKGKKSITHIANKIKSDKDLTKYFNKLYDRFKCPLITKREILHHYDEQCCENILSQIYDLRDSIDSLKQFGIHIYSNKDNINIWYNETIELLTKANKNIENILDNNTNNYQY